MNDFISFAKTHNVEIDPSRLFPSEKIRRCGTIEKPRSGNGAYFWDGQRGWVMDWSGEARVVWFDGDRGRAWTAEEKRLWAQKRAFAATDQMRRYQQAAEQAQITLNSAKLEHHPYLEMKGFPDEKGLVLGDKLLIPMRNVSTNKLQGYQEIWWNMDERKYDKKMLFGMRAKNGVFIFGNKNYGETWLVEGYATGLSVWAALRNSGLNAAVVVAFSASNLVQVADQIGGKRFIFADHDESKTGQKAAEQTRLPWTMPDEIGWDANDLHKKSGLFQVTLKIMNCRVKTVLANMAERAC
jgi:phage/plasmid primase-like uncharacterized protein